MNMACWFALWVFCFFSFHALASGEEMAPELARKLLQSDEVYDVLLKDKLSMKEDENFFEYINRVSNGKAYDVSSAALEKEGRQPSRTIPDVVPVFDCILNSKPKQKARNVHELTPYDVDVVAAFGDSLTAAFGAKAHNLAEMFHEWHGISWSIGGDNNVHTTVTLPNVMKLYNPNLAGYALGIAKPLTPSLNEYLDVAVSGSTSYGLMKQAKNFVQKLKSNSTYDYENSWKVLTLFIGGNDLCASCKTANDDINKFDPDNFVKQITNVLDYLHVVEEVPKLFVNLVSPPNVTFINEIKGKECDFTHSLECRCGSTGGANDRDHTSEVFKGYNQRYIELIGSGRYDTRDDFTVVLQPIFMKLDPPRLPDGDVDSSYFAPDCFHFSPKAHAASAVGLWNAMLEPVGKKSTTWKPNEPFLCPTDEHPYFYTRKNSGNQQREEL